MELLTVRQVAAMLKLSTRQVFKLSTSGRLPEPVKLARSTRWRESDIARWIESGCDMSEYAARRQAVSHDA